MTDKEQWFWEQCGLSADKLPCLIIDCEEERSHALCKDCHVLYPPIDLNNLFKYAVPKAIEKIDRHHTAMLLASWAMAVPYKKEDPAQALYQAICKAFGGENE